MVDEQVKSLSRSAMQHGKIATEVQDYLVRYGYLPGKLTAHAAPARQSPTPAAIRGVWDDATVQALREYQEFNGLQVTGILDDETVHTMSLPRCGVPDHPRTNGTSLLLSSPFVLAATKWPGPVLTYGFNNTTGDLTQAEVEQAIREAAVMWSTVTHLDFRQVPANANPDIRIIFAAGVHGTVAGDDAFDGPNGTLAHAFFPPPNGGDIAGDIHFDEDEPWTVQLPVPVNSIDLVTVAAHEFGHALGLDHSNVPGALMAPTYIGAQRQLAADDRDGIRALYGPFTWSWAGNTAGFGHGINDGRPFWIGDFNGNGRSDVLFYYPGDDNWWLGSHDGAQLSWSLISNTAGFGHGIHDGRPFWTGRFSRADRDEILFYYPGDDNWWLGSHDGAQLSWRFGGNTRNFGGLADGRPIWIGDFNGNGRSDVLFYYPGDDNWWLGAETI